MKRVNLIRGIIILLFFVFSYASQAQEVLSFPGAEGYGRFAQGARGHSSPSVYFVTNLNDSGPGSFRDAVSQPGRFVIFKVGGIIQLQSRIAIAANTTVAGHTAPGDGVVVYGRGVSFSGSNHTIARYLRVRLGANGGAGKNEDASGIANGHNIILDHMSFSWGLDENFSINWDNKGTDPDNITIQNSIIGQGLHRHNHSAGGLIQSGGKVSILKSLYMSNKTRNPKVKGINEFVNNVVYNYGNANTTYSDHSISADGYILGDSEGRSDVLILNNYFVGGPATPSNKTTPFSRGNANFNVYEGGNYYDNNQNGTLDGELILPNSTWYPGLEPQNFKTSADYPTYPSLHPSMTAAQAYQFMIDKVGATLPVRDQVDGLLIDDLSSKGTKGFYAYRENDLPLENGGLGRFDAATLLDDTDNDGIPDEWEDRLGLDKEDATDALKPSNDPQHAGYLNIEVYINMLADETTQGDFIRPVRQIQAEGTSEDVEPPTSTVKLTWQNSQANRVVIERSVNQEDWTTLVTTEVGVEEYLDNQGLVPNTLYYYRFKSMVDDEESTFSYLSYRTPAIPAAPEAPMSPQPVHAASFVMLTDAALDLKWVGSENTTYYEVFLGETADNLVKVSTEQVTQPSFTLSNLTNDKTFFWRVDAINDKGKTTGETWTFTTEKVFEPQLVGYWKFDETEGENATSLLDHSTFANHGVLSHNIEEGPNLRIDDGISGRAIGLKDADKSTYAANIPHADHLFLSNSSFTLGFWMKGGAEDRPEAGASAYLFCKGSISKNEETGATGNRFNLEVKDAQFRFAIDNDALGKDEIFANSADFFTGEWVYVTVVRDVENKLLKFYKNAAEVKRGSVTKALYGIGEESDLIIGNIGELEFLKQNTVNSAPYGGQMDEVKLFNYALTEEQIESEYTALLGLTPPHTPTPISGGASDRQDRATVTWEGGENAEKFRVFLGTSEETLSLVEEIEGTVKSFTFSSLEVGVIYFWKVESVVGTQVAPSGIWSFQTSTKSRELIAHYTFDDPAQIGKDNTKYANHAEPIGFEAVPHTPSGKRGGAADFAVAGDAAQKRLAAPSTGQNTLSQESFTISYWMKGASNTYTTSAVNAYVVHKGSFNKNTGGLGKWFGVQLSHNGNINFAIDDDATKTDAASSIANNNLFNNEWNHIVATRDYENKTTALYVNGTRVQFVENIKTIDIGESDRPLEIGNSAENRSYRDLLDDLKIYNYALNQEDIQRLYTQFVPVQKAVNGFPAHESEEITHTDLELTWEGDEEKYNVYWGTSLEQMSLLAEGLTGKSYAVDIDLSGLTTYYWRVDAVRGDESIQGDVWHFKTENKVTYEPFSRKLIAHYSFDEENNIGKDYSRYANHAEVLDFPVGHNPYLEEGKKAGSANFATTELVGAKRFRAASQEQNELSEESFSVSFWMKADANTYAVAPANSANNAYLFHKGTFSGPGFWYGMQLHQNGNIVFSIDDNTTKTDVALTVADQATHPVFNGEWKHVVAVRDFEGKTTAIYVDGVLAKMTSNVITGAIGDPNRPLEIGNSAENRSFRDHLDEFKMYNYALSPQDINRIFTQHVPVEKTTNGIPAHESVEVGHTDLELSWEGKEDAYNVYLGTSLESLALIAEGLTEKTFKVASLDGSKDYYWRVDAIRDTEVATGDVWKFETMAKLTGKELIAYYSFNDENNLGKDYSKYGNDAAVLDFPAGHNPHTDAGKLDGAANFATTERIAAKRFQAPSKDHNVLSEESFSVSFWIKATTNTYAATPANAVNNAYVFHKGTFSGPGYWYGMQLNQNGNIVFSIDDNVTKTDVALTPADQTTYPVFTGEWKHVVAVRDFEGKTTAIYVNGVLAKMTSNVATGAIGDVNRPLEIGNSAENKSFRDYLDEFKMYNYALSPEEIKQLHDQYVPTQKAVNISPVHQGVGVDFANVVLEWEGNEDKYNVYVGDSPTSLQLVAEGITSRTHEWGELEGDNKQYYWRVDAIRDIEIATGDVWTFQTMPDNRDKPIITEATFEVRENASVDSEIGQLVGWVFTGAELGNWRLDSFDDPNGNGVAPVTIDPATGMVYVNDVADFNAELAEELTLHVLVNNGEFVSDPTPITLKVIFVNEAPSFEIEENIDVCNVGQVMQIPITNISAGKETNQELKFTVQTLQNFLFRNLKVDTLENNDVVLNYQLVDDVQGLVTLNLTVTDDGGTQNGGSNMFSKQILLQINSIPEISIASTTSARILEEKEVTLIVQPALPSGYAYRWYKDNQSIGDMEYVVVKGERGAVYKVEVTSPLGCVREASFELDVLTFSENLEIEISNFLTPNNDGINDFWVIKNLELFNQNEVTVFDSRGNTVFTKRNYANDWNGISQGGRLATGVYYYKVTVDGEVYTGSISIVN
ncbi:T9SS type B sorting domain-containing protein [Sphingobacterium olei]|uniref:T9SS type B sorting domain-containing protein n=1 Tax=Sphingobacterium olei TaxID=2571155 RepID=A0A4U0PEH6_9SPHI|nr:LamG-like jellyroll fold domain-containing protein [Sphingobacterium olei]TJZ61124.1 T9SS type B sorting domain-containing protein [Sphingobacterium olei]